MEPDTDHRKIQRGFQNLYWSYGLKALLGVLVLLSIDLLPLPSKWFALPMILLGAWLILLGLHGLQIVSQAQHRYKHGPEDETSVQMQEPGERVLHYSGYVLLVLAYLAVSFLGDVMENIINELKWVLNFGAIGGTMVLLLFLWIKRRYPLYFRNNERRAVSMLGTVFGIISLSILLPAWLDRDSAMKATEVRRFGSHRSDSKYLFINDPDNDGRTFRIEIDRKELDRITARDSVDLVVGQGHSGYLHVLGVAISGTPR
jgi:hypothetical protein